jgi:GH15 family glucan-1,4-alpha-glucosidase
VEHYTHLRGGLDDRTWRIVVTQVEQALRHWREPDQGIWEVRSGPAHFATSKLACWKAARVLCERLLAHASPLQLYAEEIDPRTGRHLGNFPQAFTHLSLINAVTAVIAADT